MSAHDPPTGVEDPGPGEPEPVPRPGSSRRGPRRRVASWWRSAGESRWGRRVAGSRLGRGAAEYWPPPWQHVLAALVVVLFSSWALWETCGLTGCPNVDVLAAYQPGNASVVLDRNGAEVTQLSPVSRELVALDTLPQHVLNAFIAVEDRRFYDHGGVDLRRVLGSLLANVRAGGVAEGGSTITMQLARNVFPDRLPGRERTLRRKVMEVRVAREIEDRFSKDEILELYLNHIYFGGPIYGIETAARQYFGHSAHRLDLSEAAALAAMPKAPNSYNPRARPERARERRDLVLSLMATQGFISEEEAAGAKDRPIRVARARPAPERRPPPAPYFVRAVRRQLENELGDALYAQPLRIHTTLDLAAQAAAERALLRQLRAIERGVFGRYGHAGRYGAGNGVDSGGTRYLQGAVVILDADSGDVLALVGGRDYADSPFDRATGAWRQVGSAFKPFVYAAALADGYAPSQHLVDEPLNMELPGGEVWTPQNFTGGYRGEVTLREAAVQSNNVATVRLAMAVGLDEVANEARDAGVRSRLPMLPSLALGTAGLTLLELTAAYTPFATLGTAAGPRFVTRVEDRDGKVVFQRKVERWKALEPGVAYLTTDLLRDVVDRGTGREVRDAGSRGRAAGKTGTTDQGHDAWFVGFTPEVVAGVWIGFDRPATIVDRASGGRLAAPVWARMMTEIHAGGGSATDWERPSSVVKRDVDPASGLVLAEGCRPERGEPVSELFIEKHLPAEICPAGGEDGPGFFRRVARGVKTVFSRVGGFIAGLFDRDDDEDAERERYLGKPRLPEARDVRRVDEPDTTTLEPPGEPIGVPLDSLPPEWGEVPIQPPAPDTIAPVIDIEGDTADVDEGEGGDDGGAGDEDEAGDGGDDEDEDGAEEGDGDGAEDEGVGGTRFSG